MMSKVSPGKEGPPMGRFLLDMLATAAGSVISAVLLKYLLEI
jgi:hypothetical protein